MKCMLSQFIFNVMGDIEISSWNRCQIQLRWSAKGDMEPAPTKKKSKKGGVVVRFKPQSTKLLDSNPTLRDSFQHMGCPLEFQFNVDSIATTTEIPRQGEQWCKVMKFQLINCNDFLKNDQNNRLNQWGSQSLA